MLTQMTNDRTNCVSALVEVHRLFFMGDIN